MKNKKIINLAFQGLAINGKKITINLKKAINSKMSFKSIAQLLNTTSDDICRQFNQMAKESNYKLFKNE